ncbi:MAG: carboxypeptidase regulatory-like domain-containing protein [Deltaproteobacteria bacterium]|nr:carboxypeptidase regulatory-like domain-containing protein [Deltaproteobacteria bacterium]
MTRTRAPFPLHLGILAGVLLLSLCGCLGGGSAGVDPPGTITGTVSIPSTGKTAGIAVLLPALRLKTVTDNTGAFTFANLPAGPYTVQAEDNAYRLQDRKTVTVNAGRSSGVVLTLVPDNTIGTVVGSVPRSALDPSGRTITASVRDNYLFLGDHFGGAPIVDVADPRNPVVQSIIGPISILPRGTTYMTYPTEDGDHLAIVNNIDGFLYYDITDKAAPILLRQVYLVDNAIGGIDPASLTDYPYAVPAGKFVLYPQSVTGKGDTLYVAGMDVILIYDISNRANPVQTGAVDRTRIAGDGADIHIHDNTLLYSGSDLVVFDITNPRAPARLGSYTPVGGWSPTGAAGFGKIVGMSTIGHLGLGIPGIQFINVTDPASPSALASFPAISQGMDSSWDGYFYAGTDNSMTVYKADEAAMSISEMYSVPVVEDYAMNVAVSGDYAYVSDKTKGLKIVKIK